jgi:hypothetical protein
MKKMLLTIATVAALAATASAPAEAHRLRVRPGAAAVALATGAVVAAATAPLVADPYVYEPGYYYAPTPLYYGAAPVVLPFRVHRHHWW